MPSGTDAAAAQTLALTRTNVQRAIAGRRVQRAVHVPDRLINLVTG